MKIAQVSPLFESVPPKLYGGTERIVSYLTEELVRRGHKVTLFASGDSETAAELVDPVPRALRLNPGVRDWIPYHMMLIEEVRRRGDEFDVIHFHTDLLHMPLTRMLAGRSVTTLHGRLDLPDLEPFYRAFPDAALVSISEDQRRPMPPVNWVGTVYHGLPPELLPFSRDARGGYLAFLGRISPEKRPDRAIEIAARAGWPLKIAAKVDEADWAYWTEVIRPLVDCTSGIEYIGEIDEAEKAQFLGDAAALLFPIDWPEPFGLVMIEAMACGTPVIAWENGAVPEVIEDGVTGYVVRSMNEAVDAVGRLGQLSRAEVRRVFEEHFSVGRMARDYERIYRGLPGVCEAAIPVFRQKGRTDRLQVAA